MQKINLFIEHGIMWLAPISIFIGWLLTNQGIDCFICNKSEKICETTLNIQHYLTMVHQKKTLYSSGGKLFYYDVTNTSAGEPVDVNEVITADGWEQQRLVVVANLSLPGPPIIVYEGQTIKIHVKNHLQSETVSIHWHGLPQRGTPHMDGTAFVTQCPILPYQTFTYTFKAEPKGTYWYHAHVGTQRNKGLHGALVIRPMVETEDLEERIMTVGDWNHDWDGDMDHAKMNYGLYQKRVKYVSSQSLDGAFFSNFFMHSGLINGRGRYYDPVTGKHNEAPVEIINVKPSKKYRFRVIGTGALYPFRVSVDNHEMTVIASDGYDIEPQTVQSFIINPGERYDVILTTDQPVSNYWIRAKTLETIRNHHVEAILRYDGALEEEPLTHTQNCSSIYRCQVMSCPFSFYPKNEYTDCISFNQLKANTSDDPAPPRIKGKFQQFFLNFGFTPGVNNWPSVVNGRSFLPPGVSALSQPKELENLCSNADCGEQKTCICMNAISLNHGNTIEMIISNMAKASGWSHPVHMHGHTFHVLKMGFATYNETTGKFIEDNLDIDCRGGTARKDSYCNNPTWSNSTWLDGDVPGLELERPPRKDTLIIPTGGYAVIRFKSDNPGVWILHCHIKLHFSDGMAILLNESFSRHPLPPKGFPVCNDFPRAYEMPDAKPTQAPKPKPTPDAGMYSSSSYWVAVGILIAVGVVEFFVIVYLCCKARKKKQSKKYLSSQTNPAYSS
ncbi:hypothetical protein KUTeg_021516 [Tegillarca granosa]|uniref:Laccase n=1 Tax=Tegillarca granosa TaxID=220873 RepID=A0ABQ9E8W3_TEGGR|nr:hypothetical protein KUTeg_021516 [Tegillarca granosa]